MSIDADSAQEPVGLLSRRLQAALYRYDCPDKQQLFAYADGSLTTERSEEVRRHADECTLCRDDIRVFIGLLEEERFGLAANAELDRMLHLALVRADVLHDTPVPVPVTADYLQRLKPRIERGVGGNLQSASDVARALSVIANELVDPMTRAIASWIQGNVLLLIDQPRLALDALFRAEAGYKQSKDELEIARLSGSKILALERLGRYREGWQIGRSAISLLEQSDQEQDRTRLASIYNNIGICAERLGFFRTAIECYRYKLDYWHTQSDTRAEVQAAFARLNIGFAHMRLNEFDQAQQEFTWAREALIQHAEWTDIARIDMDVAWSLMLRGASAEELASAFQRAQESRRQADPTLASNDLVMLDILEAEWHLQTGQVRDAEEVLLEQLQARCESAGLAYEHARVTLLLGEFALARNEVRRGRQFFESVARAAAVREDNDTRYMALTSLSTAYRMSGDREMASDLLVEAMNTLAVATERLRGDDIGGGRPADKLLALRDLQPRASQPAQTTATRSKVRVQLDVLRTEPEPMPKG